MITAARRGRRWRLCAAAATLLAATSMAVAQMPNANDSYWQEADESSWQEGTVPPAPSFHPDRLIEVEMPVSASVRVGIAPQTIQLDPKDGVVRYVVVVQGRQAINAGYEGIRCKTRQYRIYARKAGDQPWQEDPDSPWRDLGGPAGMRTGYPHALAAGGLCDGKSLPRSARDAVRELEFGHRSMYR